MTRYLFPLVLGIVGCAILVSLGVWQVQRLSWKEGVLAEIETRIGAQPIPLPSVPDPLEDRYLPVRVEGRTTGEELHVLVSVKQVGAGYRIISAFETDGRRIMVDEGFVRTTAKEDTRPPADLTITGNLHWPEEVDSFTPDNDIAANIWFARDVATMAEALGTEPVLLIARDVAPDPRATPIPVDTAGIPNDHLEYAVTWFGLALVWAGMTGYMLWRIRRRAA